MTLSYEAVRLSPRPEFFPATELIGSGRRRDVDRSLEYNAAIADGTTIAAVGLLLEYQV